MKKYLLKLFPVLHRVIIGTHLDTLAAATGLFRPRIVVHVDGGLASQMLQFALGYAVSKKTDLPLYLETAFYKNNCKDNAGTRNRFFLLFDTFPEVRKMMEGRLAESNRTLFMRLFRDDIFPALANPLEPRPEILSGRSLYLSKYYPIEYYIKDYLNELRPLFVFRPELNAEETAWEARIKQAPVSCFIHVRRGDFVNSPLDVCTPDYFHRAIRKMKELHPEVTFFVFSNQEQYAREVCESSGSEAPFVYVSGRSEADPRVDFYLMTICSNGIFSNSGFSLAAAMFGSAADKVCIYPTYWNAASPHKEQTEEYFQKYLPANWLALEPHASVGV